METAWLIERQDPANPGCVLAESFLGFRGNLSGPRHGVLDWLSDVQWALRFARRDDAENFIGIMEVLQDRLPYSETLLGLRTGDPRAIAVEHSWS